MENTKDKINSKFIDFLLIQAKEGDYWDFKQEWHEKIEDLIKDIVCFANTAHEDDCYLIFGIADNLEVTGMEKPRRKQSDIIDTISKIPFAGENFPSVAVDSLEYKGKIIDVLTIHNTYKTPLYLNKDYGSMLKGCIYARVGDKNTPNKGNADADTIEKLWKKRFGLLRGTLEYVYDRLKSKEEWVKHEQGYYHCYKPEYIIQIEPNYEDKLTDEFYSYAMENETTLFGNAILKYQQIEMKSYQIVYLDSGRLCIPVPVSGFIGETITNPIGYRYYIVDTPRYNLLELMYNSEIMEEKYAFQSLLEVVLLYTSENERKEFEEYVRNNRGILEEKIAAIEEYNYIETEIVKKTNVYKRKLKTGKALNEMLKEWRKR